MQPIAMSETEIICVQMGNSDINMKNNASTSVDLCKDVSIQDCYSPL